MRPVRAAAKDGQLTMYGVGYIITYSTVRVLVYGSDGKWASTFNGTPRLYQREGRAKSALTQVGLPPGQTSRAWLRVIPVAVRYCPDAVSLWDIITRPFKHD